MNPVNPFQIPACLHQADLQQRRRERFKRGVIAVMFAIMALLVVLLIQGCVTEHSKASATHVTDLNPVEPQSSQISMVQPKPSMPATPCVIAQPVVSAPQPGTPQVSPAESVYVVKPGDNLTHIAKLHGITIKAIQAANNLTSDRIVVGAKLKIPQA